MALDDRRHQFSTTLEQHNAAVARYRLTARGADDAGMHGRSCYNPVDDASLEAASPRGPVPTPWPSPAHAVPDAALVAAAAGHALLPPDRGGRRAPARSGPYIIAANHHNYLDGVVLGLAVPEPIAFIVMPRVYRATPLHRPFHDRIGSIPINLERPDVSGLRRALGALERGAIVGIFPEGPFSVRGRLERGPAGGRARSPFARRRPSCPRRSGEPTRPSVGRRFYLPRRHPVTVRFGPARRFGADLEHGRPARAAVTRRIMDDIAALLDG